MSPSFPFHSDHQVPVRWQELSFRCQMFAVYLGTFLEGVLWTDVLSEHGVGIAVAQNRGQS